MDMNSGVNPAQSDPVRVEMHPEPQAVIFHREPPPPYEDTFNNNTRGTAQVIVQTIVQPPLKNSPMIYICPACGERVLTKVTYSNTRKTHMLAGFICGFTFWCSLCCLAAIPYLTKTFKKAHHYCPICSTFLGASSI